MIVFRPIAPGDCEEIARRIRPMDKREIEALVTPEDEAPETLTEHLERAVRVSTHTSAVLLDDELKCILGVMPDFTQKLSGIGVPWLIGVEGIERHWAHFARGARQVVAEMLEAYPHLRNFVHAENKPAIKLLAWCGFSLRDPMPFGARAELFHLFEKEV